MPENPDDSLDEFEEEEYAPSKSELKRRMHARQELGASLVELGEKQLARIPIEDETLLEAIREGRHIRSNSARKRHLQFIGKLMRAVDPAPIERALAELYETHRHSTENFHDTERLRDEALAAGNEGAEMVLSHWPEADRQKIRQLILQHQREKKQGKPPAASRKLFKYLRELQQSYG